MDEGKKGIKVVVNPKLEKKSARALVPRILSMYITTQKYSFIHIPKNLSQTPKIKTKSQTKTMS